MNSKKTTKKAAGLAIIAVSIFCTGACAADWPQWRGPNRDGVWQEEGIIERFDDAQLPIRWRAKIADII
jgi:hypothetical protein